MIDIYANSFKVQDLLFTVVVLIYSYMQSVYLTVFTFIDYKGTLVHRKQHEYNTMLLTLWHLLPSKRNALLLPV